MNRILLLANCHILTILLTLLLPLASVAQQIFPVSLTTQLAPPYSVNLADYAAPGVEQLRVIVLQRDLTHTGYRLRLSLRVELNGRTIIRTSPGYYPAPIAVEAGVPTLISGSQLLDYLNPDAMEFSGYSREAYLRTKALPEGAYRIAFTAYDYDRPEVAVSAESAAFCYLAKAEPPLLTYPFQEAKLPQQPVPLINFQWTPRNTASPNSAGNTAFRLDLFELRAPGVSAADVARSTSPIFSEETERTSFSYGPAQPLLEVGMRYAWRVQAIDRSGTDRFRNGGYSDLYTFTYGSQEPNVLQGYGVDSLQVVAVPPRNARASWVATPGVDSYELSYRRVGFDTWTTTPTTGCQLPIPSLAPSATFEFRIRARKGQQWGDYSALVNFTTPAPKPVAPCGESPDTAHIANRTRMSEIFPGTTVTAGPFEVTLLKVKRNADGSFAGEGYVILPFMSAEMRLKVQFTHAVFNTSFQLIEGTIPVCTSYKPGTNAVLGLDGIITGGGGTGVLGSILISFFSMWLSSFPSTTY